MMSNGWTIGRLASCDLQVDYPGVSGQHCRLVRDESGFLLSDLGSSNGTFVNGERIAGSARVSRTDRITLGTTQVMPWPGDVPGPAIVRELRIGRESDNDLVVPLATVSAYHARVVWFGEPGWAEIEDLVSSNGTSLNMPGPSLRRAYLRASDTIFLGTVPLPAEQVFARLTPKTAQPSTVRPAPRTLIEASPAEVKLDGAPGALAPVGATALAPVAAPSSTMPEARPVRSGEGPAISNTVGIELRALAQPWWKPQGLLGAALLGAALVAGLGGEGRASGLALLVVGLGLLVAACDGLTRPEDDLAAPGACLSRAALGLGQALVLSVCAWFTSLAIAKSPASVAALGVLSLGSAAGFAVGILALVALRRAVVSILVMSILMTLMILLQPASGMSPALRGLSVVSPARWTFEGVLLSTEEQAGRPNQAEAILDRAFPLDTGRMGPLADMTALLAMLVGLAGTTAFVVSERNRSERPGERWKLVPAQRAG